MRRYRRLIITVAVAVASVAVQAGTALASNSWY
jgi:hypothetical protein